MIISVIEQNPDDWMVWAQLEEGNPRVMNEAFVIGQGPSRDAAIIDAIAELHKSVLVLLRDK